MKKESFLMKLWNTLWPLLIYLVMQNLLAMVGVFVMMMVYVMQNQDADGMVRLETVTAGAAELTTKYTLVFLLISALICIPIYYSMYRKDCRKTKEIKRNIPMTNKDIFCIIISSAALALGLNNIITLTPIPYLFRGYENTNEIIFGGGIVMQILAAGIFACVVEELAMRGIVYKRMKRYWGAKKAMYFSALVFGIYHFNVVQGVYAFLLGLFLVWLLERYDTLWAPIIAHMSANLFVVMLSESGVFEMFSTGFVPFCLVTCTSMLIFYYGRRWMKHTNPLVDLEFVSKEPDTLKGLTDEYKEQDRDRKEE